MGIENEKLDRKSQYNIEIVRMYSLVQHRQEMKKKYITVRIIGTVVISLRLSLVTYCETFGGEPEFTKNCLKH